MKNIYLSISSPCGKAVLVSIKFSFHIFCVINVIAILSASFEHVGDSFCLFSLYFSAKHLLLNEFLQQLCHLFF